MAFQFEYSGVDRSGQSIQGLAEGENPIAVVLQLKQSGVTVYSIKKKFLPDHLQIKREKRISSSDLIAFNAQLALLLKTKLPLAESLRHLSRELGGPRLKAVLERMTGQLETGRTLAESLAYHKEFFPPLYINMIDAGEKSGNLAEVLHQASQYFRSVEDFRRKFLNVLIYPAILTVLAVAVLLFLIKLMVPPYVEMYSGFYIDFPLSLKSLVWIEEFIRPNLFWAVITPLTLIALGAVAIYARKNETLRMYRDRIILRIPVWGQLIKEAILTQSIATLAILLRSGIPLHESLGIIRNLISNRPLRNAFESVTEDVLEGQPLSQPLVKQSVFPLELAWLIRNGEVRGDLVGSLDGAKRMCQSKFEFASQMILGVLEPTLLVIMGAIIVAVAIALFYPLYSLSKYLGV